MRTAKRMEVDPMAVTARDVLGERAEILREIKGRTLLTAFAEMTDRLGDQAALKWKEGDAWRTLTWHEFRQTVLDLAAGLRALGFKPGEFSVIMSRNRPEAVIADLATQHARGVPVHLYNTLPSEQIEYIVNHCEATVAFLEDQGFLNKFEAVREWPAYLRRVITFESPTTGNRTTTWADALAVGRAERERDPSWAEAALTDVGPEDLATVIYTSGTTGPPKGVMDTHASVLYMQVAIDHMVPFRSDARTISYFPLAHAAARTLDVWGPVAAGGTVHFCPDPLQLVQYALEVRPTRLVGVPRVWEKLHSALTAGIASIPDAQIRAQVERAIEVGRLVTQGSQRGGEVPADLRAEHERGEPVRRSIRAKVGLDECTQAASAAAPIDPAVIEFFQALGTAMTEAWGMSELACIATVSELDRPRNGTVGYALPGIEIKLAADGEVLVRGPLVMKGYYKDPAKTAEALDPEGWLHTGDIGAIDSDGYLTIIDRKKELIITSGGKNISPANIEYLLMRHELIGQALAIGDRRNYVTALLVLDPITSPVWARQHGLESASLDDLCRELTVLAEVQRAVDAANQHLARVEQVKRFVLLAEQWTPESGELTPTLKLKRRVILERHAEEIEALYPV
jgi:long-chain acyl-CoA synthetase